VQVREAEGVVPQAIRKPAIEIADATSNLDISRLRRKPNGAPNSTAQSIKVPLFHGTDGAWFAAPLMVAMVTVVRV
jgi:hypothetical protein